LRFDGNIGAVVLPYVMIEALADELQKIADVDHKEVERVLRPGDILVTKPKNLKGLHHKMFRPLLKAFQGTEYTHAALYVGDGKIVDSGLWKGKAKVTKVGLKNYIDRYNVKVLRVREATKSEIKDAVDYAKGEVGKPFSTLKMLRLALPTGSTKLPRSRQELGKLFCSELVANAYPEQNFAAGKHIQHVRPVDLQKSPLTKTVAKFEG
jgi:uncharacterized protein YycO